LSCGPPTRFNRSRQAGGFGPGTLISIDRDLDAAATAKGLTVDDPDSHP
jgi:hypothetical protein